MLCIIIVCIVEKGWIMYGSKMNRPKHKKTEKNENCEHRENEKCRKFEIRHTQIHTNGYKTAHWQIHKGFSASSSTFFSVVIISTIIMYTYVRIYMVVAIPPTIQTNFYAATAATTFSISFPHTNKKGSFQLYTHPKIAYIFCVLLLLLSVFCVIFSHLSFIYVFSVFYCLSNTKHTIHSSHVVFLLHVFISYGPVRYFLVLFFLSNFIHVARAYVHHSIGYVL